MDVRMRRVRNGGNHHHPAQEAQEGPNYPDSPGNFLGKMPGKAPSSIPGNQPFPGKAYEYFAVLFTGNFPGQRLAATFPGGFPASSLKLADSRIASRSGKFSGNMAPRAGKIAGFWQFLSFRENGELILIFLIFLISLVGTFLGKVEFDLEKSNSEYTLARLNEFGRNSFSSDLQNQQNQTRADTNATTP